MLNTVELFCGTKSFSKVAEKIGHHTITFDNNISFNPTVCIDVLNMNNYGLRDVDIIWASPPCTAFSVASIGKNWKNGNPISVNAELGLKILDKTIYMIKCSKPKYWYIENPRGMMRKFIDDIFEKYDIKDYRRVTVTYCQYGDTRMKPTDIWTNDIKWKPKPICHNGDSCHISAPRGSRTGTQGLKCAKDRSVIPEQLFYEILKEK